MYVNRIICLRKKKCKFKIYICEYDFHFPPTFSYLTLSNLTADLNTDSH